MNKQIIEIYKYHKSFPKEGWFQLCFLCNEITSSKMRYHSIRYAKSYIFEVYICHHCKKKIIKKDISIIFAKKCKNWIVDYFLAAR